MKPYTKLIIILAGAFLCLTGLSFFNDINIFGYEPAKMDFAFEATAAETPAPTAAAPVEQAAPKPKVFDNSPKTILFIGDSMLEGLSRRLGAYGDKNGHKVYTVIWYASSTERWGTSPRLKKYISQYKPDIVFICLGGNELFIADIKKKRTKYVQKIVADIGNIPFIWIGPPNWKEDTGINDMIKGVVGDERFFLSKNLKFERAKDGCHPTWKSAYKWMDQVIAWYKTSSNPQFKLDTPSIESKAPTKTIVHKPNE